MAETHFLDATGLICPMPILTARRALKPLAAGDRLTVSATDEAALRDFPEFCRMAGHRLLESGTGEDGILRFVIEKGAS
ncbi:sulfurtransferase TusA family protein [Radicibacter daui]|uniref:sulfurtransferase TusA family protein n=1 Tax=Radicibacter daui TaxID=3064829 RepID=UPI0040469917